MELQLDESEVCVCKGRTFGQHLMYICLHENNQSSYLTVANALCQVKHDLVGLGKAKVHKRFLIERLRKLLKPTICCFYLCR